MNYFLVLIIIGIAGFAYYQHNQDEQQVADLQHQVGNLQAKLISFSEAKPAPKTAPPVTRPIPIVKPEVKVVQPSIQLPAIDKAVTADRTASVAPPSDPNNLGTVSTLDARTYHNCKVLKVEADGVTFSHDDGITKVLYPFLPPNLQKRFNYDPQNVTGLVDAQARFDEQQAAPANTAATPPANP
jgi:hypothetical protein